MKQESVKGLISVIMGIKNCEDTLSEAVESILNQTYTKWELIMCDDGSTDATLSLAESISATHDNIIVLKNEENIGLNRTLNKCLEYASGEFVARMDGDDISLPERFEKEVGILQTTEYNIVSAQMEYFDENGIWGNSKLSERPTKNDFIRGTPFCHAPCMLRRELYTLANGYSNNPHTTRVEDYDLWFRLYELGYSGYNIQEVLYRARDDRAAVKRRTFGNRLNEVYVKFTGFRRLNIPCYYYIYCCKPLITSLVPMKLYNHIRRKRYGSTK